MRTSVVLTAAFAGCALSSPLVKREPVLVIDTVTDDVYTTQWYTVYETEGAATTVAVASSTSTSTTSTPSSTSVSSTASVPSPVYSNWAYTSSGQDYKVEYVTSTWTEAPSSTTSAAAVSTSSVSTSSAAESTTTSASSSVATTYEEIVIAHHNVHRANHSAADVTWSQDLADIALSIAETCVYEHNLTAGGGGYGQNIAAGVDSANISAVITDLFYNGEVNYFVDLYGEADPDMTNFELWGHFSQVVWKATTTVGCATYDCSSSGLANTGSDVDPYFTVCNYESPGNYAGEYADNIGEPLDYATVQWNYDL